MKNEIAQTVKTTLLGHNFSKMYKGLQPHAENVVGDISYEIYLMRKCYVKKLIVERFLEYKLVPCLGLDQIAFGLLCLHKLYFVFV